MHSVSRNDEPAVLRECRQQNLRWPALDSYDRVRIRMALECDFKGICAYCENKCSNTDDRLDSGTIEHFRPRTPAAPGKDFSSLVFDWENLMYACWRCNQMKGDLWPENHSVLCDTEGFINPNLGFYAKDAREFFTFSQNGVIDINGDLSFAEIRISRDTIEILNLNSDPMGYSNSEHNEAQKQNIRRIQKEEVPLPEQRQAALWAFIDACNVADDSRRARLLGNLWAGKIPFYSYIMWHIAQYG